MIFSQLPAAFGRLCVETTADGEVSERELAQPPSGGCVLKLLLHVDGDFTNNSRLRAAVC